MEAQKGERDEILLEIQRKLGCHICRHCLDTKMGVINEDWCNEEFEPIADKLLCANLKIRLGAHPKTGS